MTDCFTPGSDCLFTNHGKIVAGRSGRSRF